MESANENYHLAFYAKLVLGDRIWTVVAMQAAGAGKVAIRVAAGASAENYITHLSNMSHLLRLCPHSELNVWSCKVHLHHFMPWCLVFILGLLFIRCLLKCLLTNVISLVIFVTYGTFDPDLGHPGYGA